MSAQIATLTPNQQRVLFPKALAAEGDYTATIDGEVVVFQTKTIVHDTTQNIFGITGRNAEGEETVRQIYVQFDDSTPAGTSFNLAKGEFTNIRVWFSVDTATDNYSVRGIEGTLTVQDISPQGSRIHCSSVCTTDTNPSGKTHDLTINFDLHTSNGVHKNQ